MLQLLEEPSSPAISDSGGIVEEDDDDDSDYIVTSVGPGDVSLTENELTDDVEQDPMEVVDDKSLIVLNEDFEINEADTSQKEYETVAKMESVETITGDIPGHNESIQSCASDVPEHAGSTQSSGIDVQEHIGSTQSETAVVNPESRLSAAKTTTTPKPRPIAVSIIA